MKLVAAYLLAALSGKETPSAADVKAILSSVGAEADEERLSKLLSELEGKKIDEVVASGLSKLASVPSGGAVAAAAPAAGGAGGAAAAPKEEEKVEEEEEEDMGFSLFD